MNSCGGQTVEAIAGWYTKASGGTKISAATKLYGNTTYYAHWTPMKYTVTFNSESGSAIGKESVAYSTPVGALKTPTRTGYAHWAKK